MLPIVRQCLFFVAIGLCVGLLTPSASAEVLATWDAGGGFQYAFVVEPDGGPDKQRVPPYPLALHLKQNGEFQNRVALPLPAPKQKLIREGEIDWVSGSGATQMKLLVQRVNLGMAQRAILVTQEEVAAQRRTFALYLIRDGKLELAQSFVDDKAKISFVETTLHEKKVLSAWHETYGEVQPGAAGAYVLHWNKTQQAAELLILPTPEFPLYAVAIAFYPDLKSAEASSANPVVCEAVSYAPPGWYPLESYPQLTAKGAFVYGRLFPNDYEAEQYQKSLQRCLPKTKITLHSLTLGSP
ncbi:MAG: hypothetical protein LBS89_06175 [Zoogloeaceae bacterium]|jgi:hypothetical protein|nr:hypothetical protein [Zoogloeaceae bacterium]